MRSNGENSQEVKKRILPEWDGWKRVKYVTCGKGICQSKKIINCGQTSMYGLQTVPLTTKQEAELEKVELKDSALFNESY